MAGGDTDPDYFEGVMLATKTGKSREKATTFLPLIVPLHGLSGLDWWSEFLDVRSALDMPDIPSLQEAGDAPSDDGPIPVMASLPRHRDKPVKADEVTAALVETLRFAGFNEKSLENLASHSLKATWLTTTGKQGVGTQSRQLLGYHVPKGEDSALNYNRDNLAKPMEDLVMTIFDVRIGKFLPDATRGRREITANKGYIPAVVQMEDHLGLSREDLASQMANRFYTKEDLISVGAYMPDDEANRIEQSNKEGKVEEKQQQDQSSTEEGLSSSSDTKDEGGEDTNEKEVKDHVESIKIAAEIYGDKRSAKKKPPEEADDGQVLVHKMRGTVHFANKFNSKKLGCGRKRTEQIYLEMGSSTEGLWPRCSDCMPED